LSLAIAGVGIAQHAVDYCTAHVDRMGVGRTSAVEREAIRHDIAEATTEVDAAWLLIRRTVGEIERAGKARIEPIPRALIELVARDRHFATLYALRATDRLFRAAGSQVLFEGTSSSAACAMSTPSPREPPGWAPSPVPPGRPRYRSGGGANVTARKTAASLAGFMTAQGLRSGRTHHG
jgi:alkylation response protein AidB-like acyl-CoA dehydrogenase